MELIPIDEPEDPRLFPYMALRERDLVARQGRFVAEGEVVLRVLLGCRRFRTNSLLVLDARLPALGPSLALAPEGTPVYVATRAVMDRVVGFPIHRGVLALGERGREPSVAALLDGLPARALVLVLVGLVDPDNVGACFRNAAAFGADAVLLDGASCDPLYRKAIRVSAGASLTVPFARAAPGADLLDALATAGFESFALAPRGAEAIDDVRASERTALVLGAEGAGLPPELLARARCVRIPMAPGVDSLNVAVAGAVALHRLAGLA